MVLSILWLVISLPLENQSPGSDFLQQAEQRVCLWWWPMLHSGESSVKGPLRETWLHGFTPSWAKLVLNSRQMCSCARPVTWWWLYYRVQTIKGLFQCKHIVFAPQVLSQRCCSSKESSDSSPHPVQFSCLMKWNCYLMTETKLNYFWRVKRLFPSTRVTPHDMVKLS